MFIHNHKFRFYKNVEHEWAPGCSFTKCIYPHIGLRMIHTDLHLARSSGVCFFPCDMIAWWAGLTLIWILRLNSDMRILYNLLHIEMMKWRFFLKMGLWKVVYNSQKKKKNTWGRNRPKAFVKFSMDYESS